MAKVYAPWQERLIKEQEELESKLRLLSIFIDNGYNGMDISNYEALLLANQQLFMEEYNETLLRRIELFRE